MISYSIEFARRGMLAALTLFLLAGSAAAWQQTRRDEQPAGEAVQPQQKPDDERRISEKDAQKLFATVDEILRFASTNTKLPIRHPVKRKLLGREELREFMASRAKEEGETGRVRRSEAVLKKFGLVPRDFDLQKFLADLQAEQVLGFYDTRTATVYLLDWVEPAAQRSVLAHELAHALQDQTIGLEAWLKEGRSSSKEAIEPEGEAKAVELDERTLSRRALVEGQAMHVLVNYTLAAAEAWAGPAGSRSRSPQNSPEYTAMFDKQKKSPLLERAPLFIRESMTFPYSYGYRFVQDVADKRGKEGAFAGLLRNPPLNTYQIMNPRSYFNRERAEPMRVPAITPLLGDGLVRFDTGTMGALEVMLFLQQFANHGTARKLSRKWRGGFYYTAARGQGKAATEGEGGGQNAPAVSPAALALLYVSRWASAEDAARFAGAYSAALLKRYLRVTASAAEVSTRGSVTHIGPPTRWSTEEGMVVVQACGDTVLALESFDASTAARLRSAFLGPCLQAPAAR
ncbi:MAG: ImmA/IrrE family metallo-endopeptidase [Terriglobales bacterium]